MSVSNIMFRSTTKLGQHHEVLEILGAGSFGRVAKCLNTQTHELEAVKVVKTRRNCVASARREIEILQYLRCYDPEARNIMRFNSFFFHKEMICLSFELLDCDLTKYISKRQKVSREPFLLSEVKPMIYQLATALECLQSAKVIHGDIKPENIMVVDRNQQPPKLKLVDFGGAHLSCDADPYTIVRTVNYSPPEVLIGAMYNEAVDIWALGIISVELVIGSPLYLGDGAYDILKGILATQGQPPDHILNLGDCTSQYFHKKEDGNPGWSFKTPEEYKKETGYRSDSGFNTLDFLEEIMMYETDDDIELFVDLVKGMLELDFSKRLTPQQVLQHPFFADSIPQSIPPTQVCFEEKPMEERGIIQKSSCSQNRWQEDLNDCLEVPIASLPAAEDSLEVVQLESPGNPQLANPGDIQLEIPSEVHVGAITDVHLEIPSEVHVGATTDVQLEIPSDIHVEATTDVQLEIPVDVQPNNNAHSGGFFMRLIRWVGNTFHCSWTRLMCFFRNDN